MGQIPKISRIDIQGSTHPGKSWKMTAVMDSLGIPPTGHRIL